MKKFLVVCLLLVLGMALFAQSNGDKPIDVKAGRTYIVKSADGSGKVPIYDISDNIRMYVPDGTELYATHRPNPISGKVQVRSTNKDDKSTSSEVKGLAFVARANFGEETPASIASRERNKGSNSIRFSVVLFNWALLMGGCFFIRKRNKNAYKKIYAEYYMQKRKEYPWLDAWLKDYEEPADVRAYFLAAYGFDIAIKVFVVIGLVVSFVGIIILPNTIISHIATIGTIVLTLFISSKIWAWSIKAKPATDNGMQPLTFECPACHCPHSWGKIAERNIVAGANSETITETTEKWDEDASGNRVFGSTSFDTKRDKITVYKGKIIHDYKCENCGHKHHDENLGLWESMPNIEPQYFDDPVKALRLNKKFKAG
jgi:hypothetical protein